MSRIKAWWPLRVLSTGTRLTDDGTRYTVQLSLVITDGPETDRAVYTDMTSAEARMHAKGLNDAADQTDNLNNKIKQRTR
jgi:hypothetical protein